MRFIFWSLLALAFLASSSISGHAQDRNSIDLEVVSIKTNPYWMHNYNWDIAHSAQPGSWEMWKGDRGRSLFTVDASRSDGHTAAWVQGEVCIYNHRQTIPQDLVVSVKLLSSGAVISVTEAFNDNPIILVPAEETCLRYRLEVPENFIVPGGNYAVTAQVSATNSSSSTTKEKSVSFQLPPEPEIHNEQVQISVPGSGTWTLTDSGQVQYEQTFTCDAAQGLQERTATIVETGQAARAAVNISCYALDVWPVVRTYFNRVHNWGIEVGSNVENLTLQPGETAQVEYQVQLNNLGYTDLYYRASGSIYVRNPAPIPAAISGLEAMLSRGRAVKLNCSAVQFPYILASGEMINCHFSTSPVEGEKITASTALTNINYHYSQEMFTGASTRFESTPYPVSYRSPQTIYESYECIQVGATSLENIGRACRNETGSPTTITFSRQVGPYDQCGVYAVDEYARILPAGFSSIGTNRWQIQVQVPCASGCTQPPGYWLTYSGIPSARYDPIWDQVGNERFYKSNRNWKEMIHTNATSNPYYLLARQYIAARLNILKGAQASRDIQLVLEKSEAIFETFAPYQVARAKVSLQREIQNLVKDLDHYNRGLTGPGVCSKLPGQNR
jgi:hypothetical protein